VIDSSVVLRSVLPVNNSTMATELLRKWFGEGIAVFVPALWFAEVTSAVHKLLSWGQISADEAERILDACLNLPVRVQAEDARFYRSAFDWAFRLGQHPVYDALYLALADRLDAQFYTSDRKLYNRCQEIGASFASLVE